MPGITPKPHWAGVFLPAAPTAVSIRRLRRDMRAARAYLAEFVPPPAGPYQIGDPSLPPLNLRVFGDSSGVGVGCALTDSLPWLAATELTAEYHVSLKLYGRSGDRSEHLAGQLQAAADDVADVVLVCVGSNDATHMVKFLLSPRQVERNFRASVQEIQHKWPNAAVVLTGAADMGSLLFLGQTLAGRWLRRGLGRCARLVNARVMRVAAERAVVYAPLAKLVAAEFRRNPACFSEDGFHPGAYGYRLLNEKLTPYLWRAVRERRPGP